MYLEFVQNCLSNITFTHFIWDQKCSVSEKHTKNLHLIQLDLKQCHHDLAVQLKHQFLAVKSFYTINLHTIELKMSFLYYFPIFLFSLQLIYLCRYLQLKHLKCDLVKGEISCFHDMDDCIDLVFLLNSW